MRFIEGVVSLLSSCVIPALVIVYLDHACFQQWASVWDQCSSKRREANFQQHIEVEFRSVAHIRKCKGVQKSMVGFGKRGLLEKGSFQKSPFSRDSRELRDSRDSREPPDCGKQGGIRPFSKDSREFRDFRDSRDSSSEKTPFVMTPFSGPDMGP